MTHFTGGRSYAPVPRTFIDEADRLFRRHRLRCRGAAHFADRYEALFLHLHEAERAADLLADAVPHAIVWREGRYWRAGELVQAPSPTSPLHP